MYFSANECELAWSCMTRFASYPFSMFFFFKCLLINTLITATNHLKINAPFLLSLKSYWTFDHCRFQYRELSPHKKQLALLQAGKELFTTATPPIFTRPFLWEMQEGIHDVTMTDCWENRAQNVVQIVYSVFYSELLKCVQIADGNTTQVYFKECDMRW